MVLSDTPYLVAISFGGGGGIFPPSSPRIWFRAKISTASSAVSFTLWEELPMPAASVSESSVGLQRLTGRRTRRLCKETAALIGVLRLGRKGNEHRFFSEFAMTVAESDPDPGDSGPYDALS